MGSSENDPSRHLDHAVVIHQRALGAVESVPMGVQIALLAMQPARMPPARLGRRNAVPKSMDGAGELERLEVHGRALRRAP